MAGNSRSPKYHFIKESIIQFIKDNKLGPGAQIFSLSEIMERYGVSKVTAVRSLTELENEGIVERQHGRGTFVCAEPAERESPGSKRRTVAVIVPNMTNPFYSEIISALERQLRLQDISVELSTTDYNTETENEILTRILKKKRVAGLVITSWNGEHDVIKELAELPTVFIDFCPEELIGRCSMISCDNYRGGQDAANHLISLGHQRIVHIALDYSSRDRTRGFTDALKAHGLWQDDEGVLILAKGKPIEEEVKRFILSRKPTALFAINDMLAMQIMQLLRRMNYQIPRDISIMGYDNIEPSQYLEVPLTTLEQHDAEIGRRTASLLIESLENKTRPTPPREIMFMPRLVVRASTGPPPRQNLT